MPRASREVNIRSPENVATIALDIRPNVMWNPSNLPEKMIHNANRIKNERMNLILNLLSRDNLEGFFGEVLFPKDLWKSFFKLLLPWRCDTFSNIETIPYTDRSGNEEEQANSGEGSDCESWIVTMRRRIDLKQRLSISGETFPIHWQRAWNQISFRSNGVFFKSSSLPRVFILQDPIKFCQLLICWVWSSIMGNTGNVKTRLNFLHTAPEFNQTFQSCSSGLGFFTFRGGGRR